MVESGRMLTHYDYGGTIHNVAGTPRVASVSYKQVVEGSAKSCALSLNMMECREVSSTSPPKVNKVGEISWDCVVVCERRVVAVSEALSGWLEEAELVPYLNTRACFVCESKEEVLWVARVGKFAMEDGPKLLLHSYEQSLRKNLTKVVSYGGWVAISRLPLHWWS